MKFVSLISSGIDSPVATYLLSKKVEETILIHADGKPYIDNREIEKLAKFAKSQNLLLISKVMLISKLIQKSRTEKKFQTN